jgi:hypothetical protein
VRALCRIHTSGGQSQSFDRLAENKVLLDNLRYILRPHESIPDLLGINHNGGAMLALVQAPGRIGADLHCEAGVRDLPLKKFLQFTVSLRRTRASGASLLSPVGANEYVSFKVGQAHSFSLLYRRTFIVEPDLKQVIEPGQAGQLFSRTSPSQLDHLRQ